MIHGVLTDPQDGECAAFACRHGWAAPPGEPLLVLCRRLDPADLDGCLEWPLAGCCEVEAGGGVPVGPHFLGHVEAGGLGLALRTDTAYAADAGVLFAAALKRRVLGPGEDVPDLELATHEILANALIHGNLGIASPEPGVDGFDAYCRAMDRRLHDPARRCRRVELSGARVGGDIEIAVRDEGAGYAPGAGRAAAGPRRHGLEIVGTSAGAVLTEERGRCCVVRFPIVAGAAG